MPTPSTSKKSQMEASSSKKADATPLRISSRVRKEKFNVKELFGGSKDRDVSSDEEPAKSTPKKKPAVGATSKIDLSKPSTSKAGIKSVAEPLKSSVAKITPSSRTVVASKTTTPGRPLSSKESVVSRTPIASSSKNIGTKASILQPSKASSSVLHKTSLLKKQESLGSVSIKAGFKDDGNKPVPSPKSKVNIIWEKSESTKLDDIKAEPIFNEDNIESVLENPSSLGLDIVVTKLSESDMKEDLDSKKSKNVVTIAKLTGSSGSSKPVKVVPMKPSDKITEFEDSKGSSVTTPKGDKSRIASVLDKKRVQVRSSLTPKAPTSAQIKEVRVNKSLGNDVAAVTQSIDKGVGSPFSEKKHNRVSDAKKLKQSVDTELERCRDQVESSLDKTRLKDIQRQKAVKRSMAAVTSSRIESNGSDVRSAEADSSSTDIEIKKAKFIRDIFGESEESVEDPKPSYDFDRYFETSQSIIEHNESLDSDGSYDETENYLSHFYEKEPDGSKKRAVDQSSDDFTIYDLMHEINCEHPSWNLHVLQDTSTFLICQVTRGRHSLPVIDKMIELESDLSSAKVYVNQALHAGFKGPFDSYASIRELISNVQQL